MSCKFLEPKLEPKVKAKFLRHGAERRPATGSNDIVIGLWLLGPWAMCGRLRVGKKNLHFAALVGAAMCSACSRGTHDRWP
jgi:hypothetical protein